jgi:hypothetical protein
LSLPRAALLVLLATPALACRDTVDLEAVYARTDRDFESAVMFRPDDATVGDPAYLFAPLIVVEGGTAGSTAPDVTYARTEDGWVYRWADPDSGIRQGIRVTLGDDGFPSVYEALHDSSGARLLFVDTALEQQAADAIGPPLPGRRFSIERGVEETPEVVVGATFEPGTTPLGPFVYLWNESYDVNVVLCRCMAPRVFDIVDSIAYTLTPGDAAGDRSPGPADLLRR